MNPFGIGIDGYNLAMPNGTGVATYGRTLAATVQAGGHPITGLFGIDGGRDPALREVLFFDRLGHPPGPNRRRTRRVRRAALLPFGGRRADEVPLTQRVEKSPFADRLPSFDRIVTSPLLFEIAHRHLNLYGRFLRVRMSQPPAVMHWTYPVPVELEGAANIYTLHDLVPLKLPYTTLDEKSGYRRLVGRCIERAAQICTVSEASRADIITEFGMDPDRITNTWQASPTTEAEAGDPREDAAAIEGVFGLKHRGYFLYFGAVEPKKNIGRLIEAYLSLNTATPLVMVGGRGWRSDEELKLLPQGDEADSVHGMRMADRIVRLDHLPRALLLRLIRGARAVTFPSIYEGFGLPVLEAMQLGTPVLTSTASALPEVASDAALLIDPYDVGAIARGLHTLDTDEALRDRLSAAGPIQASQFSAEQYRDRLEALYAKALAR